MSSTLTGLLVRAASKRPAKPRHAFIDAFLFDVDGVLADTADLHAEAWESVARDYGLPVDPQVIPQLRGRSREDSLRMILAGRDIAPRDFFEIMEIKNARYVASLSTLSPTDVLPGVFELLTGLHTLQFNLAAVSASRNARCVLSRLALDEFFTAIIDGHSTPATDGCNNRYLIAAQKIACDPRRCVAVEDSVAGIQLAVDAEMCTVGLGDPQMLQGADVIFPALECVTAATICAAMENIRSGDPTDGRNG